MGYSVGRWKETRAIGERTRDALRHKCIRGRRVGNIAFGSRLAADGEHLEAARTSRPRSRKSGGCAAKTQRCGGSRPP